METTILKVDGMRCDGCAERIRRLLAKEPGVRMARVSFAEGAAEIRYNARAVRAERLQEIIETGGFHVRERTA